MSNRNKSGKKLHFFSKLLIFGDICALICFFVFYGPVSSFREWFITTALSTGKHKYLAYTMYSENMVKKVLSNNSTIESGETTDASAIKIVEHVDTGVYSSADEELILKKDPGNDDYKVIEISEDGWTGYVTVIYHPERVNLVISKKSYGSTITEFSRDYNASVAINAGGFLKDSNDNLYIKSNLILNSKVYKTNNKKAKLICMNEDNVLCLLNCTAKEAVASGMRWGVEFGPFLIVNGVAAQFKGNGGYGYHPRQSIGQRQDGIVILVTVDGRGAGGSEGASIPDLIKIFTRFNCYNAANLDGGGSTMLAVDGKLKNDPRGWGYSGERYIYNAIVLQRPSE